MSRFYFSIFISVFLFLLNGCGALVLGTVSTVRGGENDISIVKPIQNLQSYGSINLIAIKGSADKRLTSELLSYMNKKIHEELSDRGAKLTKKGQLRMSGSVLNVANSFRKKRILLQIKLHDSRTKRSIGIVNVTGETSYLRGIESAADKIAEGVTELLANYHYPGIKDSSWF